MAEKKMKINIGAVITEPGNSLANKTGEWRTFRPEWDPKKCTQCMLCWQFCPDNTIPQKNGNRLETDLEYCKGCGICAKVCPFKAIKMIKEEK